MRLWPIICVRCIQNVLQRPYFHSQRYSSDLVSNAHSFVFFGPNESWRASLSISHVLSTLPSSTRVRTTSVWSSSIFWGNCSLAHFLFRKYHLSAIPSGLKAYEEPSKNFLRTFKYYQVVSEEKMEIIQRIYFRSVLIRYFFCPLGEGYTSKLLSIFLASFRPTLDQIIWKLWWIQFVSYEENFSTLYVFREETHFHPFCHGPTRTSLSTTKCAIRLQATFYPSLALQSCGIRSGNVLFRSLSPKKKLVFLATVLPVRLFRPIRQYLCQLFDIPITP